MCILGLPKTMELCAVRKNHTRQEEVKAKEAENSGVVCDTSYNFPYEETSISS